MLRAIDVSRSIEALRVGDIAFTQPDPGVGRLDTIFQPGQSSRQCGIIGTETADLTG
jgi:hypothetical protein